MQPDDEQRERGGERDTERQREEKRDRAPTVVVKCASMVGEQLRVVQRFLLQVKVRDDLSFLSSVTFESRHTFLNTEAIAKRPVYILKPHCGSIFKMVKTP